MSINEKKVLKNMLENQKEKHIKNMKIRLKIVKIV